MFSLSIIWGWFEIICSNLQCNAYFLEIFNTVTKGSRKKKRYFYGKIPTVDFTNETLAIDDTHGDDVIGVDWGACHGG